MQTVRRFIDVALNVPLNQTFTYRDCNPSENPAEIFGRRVEVKFGNRKTTGFVVGVYDSVPSTCSVGEEKIRTALRYIDSEPVLTRELFDLARFMSGFYVSSVGECVFAMVPSGKRETDAPGFSLGEDEKSFAKKELSGEQKKAVEEILSEKNSAEKAVHYLYGKTGSGKTEVFLTVAEKIMMQEKGVIYLVPEISLTPQVTRAVQARFGETVAVLHSALTPSQRLGEWKRILRKEARIVVGARSAVFAPVPDLGLIIIDEEHDSSYKSGSSPRYNARQIAMVRCKKNSARLVMGSATPSCEAWLAMEEKSVEKHVLTKRLSGGKSPEIKCINLAMEKNQSSSISAELAAEIEKCLAEKKQTILFLNRRGFTHFFRCTDCGFEMKCKNCSVSMTFHKIENRLRCHYCGYSVSPPQQCPECGSLDVGYSGFGTEYIESEVKSKFPQARTIRLDTDSVSKKGELQQKLDEFKDGKFDILLGTQMVAKGLNFPDLKLVGVILADTSLHLPDFRAAEKTFSLITQVAGRAGRFFPDGKVLVQTFSPSADAVKFSVQAKTDEFYRTELENRKLLFFPPYSRLVRLVFRSQFQKSAEDGADGAFSILSRNLLPGVNILGPSECPLEMVNGNFRMQIILRGKKMTPLLETAKRLVWGYRPPKNVYIEVDVDPVNML